MSKIEHVSDTALWVAVHRGRETSRPDALYRDPLALRLAGERGERIARRMASARFMSWMMSIRTIGIDQLVQDAIALGAKTIVNLGAGLDTRPYRLELTSDVEWIEVDFPDMIAYKTESLKTEIPRVKLSRIALDLSDRKRAQEFYQSLAQKPGPILVITEGVIPYLDSWMVANLADDLAATPNIRYWIQDFREGGYAKGIPRWWLKVKMRFAPFKFVVPDWFGFFADHGWQLNKKKLLQEESLKYGRPMPNFGGIGLLKLLLPKKKLEEYNRTVGFALLERKPK